MNISFIQLSKNQSGATAIEYALACAFIFLFIVLGVVAVGGSVKNSYDNTSSQITTAIH
jgi:Flp pilus assembly pilin Flp